MFGIFLNPILMTKLKTIKSTKIFGLSLTKNSQLQKRENKSMECTGINMMYIQ